jgi:cysteine desulfurase
MEDMEFDNAHIERLSNKLYSKLTSSIKDIFLNGDLESRYPGNLNISFAYVEGESLIMAVKQLAVSSGSACTSASLEPSYVLRALGVDEELAHTSLRLGIGRFTTEEEVNYAADTLVKAVEKLRSMSPLWEMVQEGIDIKSIKWAQH